MFKRIRIRRTSVSPRPIECGNCGVKSNGLGMYRDFILPGRYHRGCLPVYWKDGSVEFIARRATPAAD